MGAIPHDTLPAVYHHALISIFASESENCPNILLESLAASRSEIFLRLRLPSSLPYLFAAFRVSIPMSVIGAVVAEFVAGSGTATGLAWRIVEAGNRLQIAKMFAALGLLSALGIAIFFALSLLEWALLHRWHESALKKQG